VRLSELVDEAQAPTRAARYLRNWFDAGLVTGIRHS
jgi:hypothetical protein